MIIAGLLALLLADFAVCTRIPFEEKFEALSKRQTSSHSTTKTGVRYVELPVHRCQPTAVPVEVPPPAVWPSHVKLWRCIGSVFTLGPFECGVIKEANFRLNVTISLDKVTFTAGTVPVTNHTACAAQCIVKKKDCNNATHKLDPKSCLCNCRDDNKCPSGKIWEKNDCKCKCKHIAPCTGYEDVKKFSDKTCKCECQDKFVRKCQAAGYGKFLTPDTCKCVCPVKPCPKGQVIDQTDCKCA